MNKQDYTTEEERFAYMKGIEARICGYDEKDNLYKPIEGSKYMAWLNGWNETGSIKNHGIKSK